jgi:hypothetical protein
MRAFRWAILGMLVVGIGCEPGGGPLLRRRTGSGAGQSSGGGGGGGGGGVAQSCLHDFGPSGPARHLTTFLQSTATFVNTASELERSLLDSCTRMGHDLQIPDGEMQPSSQDVPPVRAACSRVERQLREDYAAVRGAANARVEVDSTPPVCRVSVDGYAQCMGRCDASYTPAQVPRCEGGEIRGRCSGQCSGRCAVEVHGSCSGRCEGTCSGSCTGICQGHCEGTCAVRAADGSCNGACQGTCQGSCSAGCTGGCEGQCELSGQAHCEAECRGGCSVQYTEPVCTGRLVPPQADVNCNASCEARVHAEATCTPGHTTVRVEGGVTPDIQARAGRLRAAVESGMPAVRAAADKLQRLQASAQALVQSGSQVAGSIQMLGLEAIACASQATTTLPRATVSVSVSVEVSASVSGSVGSR